MKFSKSIWLGLSFLLGVAGVSRAELPSNGGTPPVAVIDLHTHVFNARDLPLAGAIDAMGRSWVSKPVAEVLKKALLALTAADDLEGPFPPAGKSSEGSVIMSLNAKATATTAVLPRNLPENLRAQVRVLAGKTPEPDVRLMKDGKDELQAEADRNLVADALRNAGFPPPESEEPEPEVKSLSVGIDDYLRFVDIRTDGSLCLHRARPSPNSFESKAWNTRLRLSCLGDSLRRRRKVLSQGNRTLTKSSMT